MMAGPGGRAAATGPLGVEAALMFNRLPGIDSEWKRRSGTVRSESAPLGVEPGRAGGITRARRAIPGPDWKADDAEGRERDKIRWREG